MAKFTDALKFWSKPLTRGVRAITGNLDEQEQGQLRQEQEKLFQSILNTTQPFRMGANTLAQNYGPAFRVLTGGDPLTPGPVEQFTREALTPEEQDYLERKPYMAALKSSVGMGSSLMPFASRAVPAATLGARTAQIAGRGLLEGLAGGFGYSREGKELQDTLVGGGIGMGGELLGNYAFDPSYRGMVNQGFQDANTGMYQAALQFGDNDIYYHQSQSKEPFTEFKQKGDKGYKRAHYSQANEGVYFSPNKDVVQSKYGKDGGQLIAVKLDFKNKLDLGNYDAMYFDGRKVNSVDIVTENFKRSMQGLPELPEPDIQLTSISSKARKWLSEQGYDAVEGMKGEMWAAPEVVVLDKSIITPVKDKGQSLAQEGLQRVREKVDGKDIEYITQRMDGEDRKVMTDFIDNTRLKKGNIDIEIEARRMAEAMGLNPDVSNSKLANLFQKILEFSPYRPK